MVAGDEEHSAAAEALEEAADGGEPSPKLDRPREVSGGAFGLASVKTASPKPVMGLPLGREREGVGAVERQKRVVHRQRAGRVRGGAVRGGDAHSEVRDAFLDTRQGGDGGRRGPRTGWWCLARVNVKADELGKGETRGTWRCH